MSKDRLIRALSVALLLALPVAAPMHAARAQEGGQEMESREGIALQNQIAELRAEVESLRNSQSNQPPAQAQPPAPSENENPPPANAENGNNGGSGDITAQLLVRVTALEEKTRELQGKVDDLTNQLQHAQDELGKQIGDINFKLNPNGAPPAGAPATPGLAPPPGTDAVPPADQSETPPPPPPPEPKRTPEMSLRAGNAALARGDYAGAIAAATMVLQAGLGPRTNDAELLLARGKAGQKQWKEAATGFYSVYKRAPKGPNASFALLGVANSLIGLGKNKDACSALAKLTAEFPHQSPTTHAGVISAKKRAACG